MAQSCCNPFDIPGHTWCSRRKNLRPVTAWMCERAPHISVDSKICDTCRKKLSKESHDVTESELPTYHYFLAKIVCNPPHPRCYLGECDVCPGIETLKEELLTHFDETNVEQIVYKQWVSTVCSHLRHTVHHSRNLLILSARR